MRVYVTGATGFVGSAVVKDLLKAGHEVLGLTRSDRGAEELRQQGADVHRGDLDDIQSVAAGAKDVDGVIHTAFNHDFSRYRESCEADRAIIAAIGDAIGSGGKPFIITSGIGLLAGGKLLTEDMRSLVDSSVMPRIASEEAAAAEVAKGVNVSVVRLPPSVHDKGDHGFVPILISIAKEKGISAYVGEGQNRWPGVHRPDAASLFRLAVEKGSKGEHYHAIGDGGIPFREIATLIGDKLGLPVKSVTGEAVAENFGWFAHFASLDVPASAAWTKQRLGWKPQGMGLLEDIEKNYFG
ncbi:MAG: SDR family oxidoreductase [Chitinophagaceae bacterium]|nr:MAG: SDR family oxidoreductase [Chitinophagaceae bacterium]